MDCPARSRDWSTNRCVPVNPCSRTASSALPLPATSSRKVHADHSHWSGILYLSAPEHCEGGTEFFRHRRTGTERMALDAAELAALGYANGGDMHRDIIERDSNDDSQWK